MWVPLVVKVKVLIVARKSAITIKEKLAMQKLQSILLKVSVIGTFVPHVLPLDMKLNIQLGIVLSLEKIKKNVNTPTLNE